MNQPEPHCTAFAGHVRVASGRLETLLTQLKRRLDEGGDHSFLIFEDQTGRQIDFDFRGSLDEILARAAPVAAPVRFSSPLRQLRPARERASTSASRPKKCSASASVNARSPG